MSVKTKDVIVSALRLSSIDLGLFIKFYGLEDHWGVNISTLVQKMIEVLTDSILQENPELLDEMDRPKELTKLFKKVCNSRQGLNNIESKRVKVSKDLDSLGEINEWNESGDDIPKLE